MKTCRKEPIPPTGASGNEPGLQAAAFFNAAAAAYDQPRHQRFYGRVAAELVALLPAGLNVERLLEVGAGTGFSTLVFQSGFPEAQVTALEPAPQMLDRGRQRLPEVEWICRPLAGMPPASFDLVASSMSYQWLDLVERQKIVKLAAGGVLALALPLSGAAEMNGNLALRKIVFQLRGGNWPRQARRRGAVEAVLRRCFLEVNTGIVRIDEEYESCLGLSRSLLERGAMHSLFGEKAAQAAKMMAACQEQACFRWTIGLFVARSDRSRWRGAQAPSMAAALKPRR